VLNQQYDNLEYIVIDGGSNDGSAEIIERYSGRLSHWISEPDTGHANAINKGFARATGDIMAWLNSDDLYFPWTLQTVAEIFAHFPEIDWITGLNIVWDEKGRIVHCDRSLKNKYDFLLGRYAWIQQESTFWRRSLWDASGGTLNEDYKFMVDGELWTRFFLKNNLHHVSCALGGYRTWGGNRSELNMDRCHMEMERCIAVMKQRCDPAVLKTLSTLRYATRLVDIARGFPLRRVLRRLAPEVLNKAGHDTISYVDGAWTRHHEPFRL
jgi:hypothetical protein